MNRLIVIAAITLAARMSFAGGQLPDAPHVYVEGEATISVAPDSLTVTVEYEQVDPTLDVARSRVNDRSRLFLQRLGEMGVVESDITSTVIGISPAREYEDGEQKLIGTRVSREVTVTLRDFKNYHRLVAAVSESNASSTHGTRMGIANEREVLAQAQVDALADARTRAERIAKAAGRELGKVYSVTEFNLREVESYSLVPERAIFSSSGVQAEFAVARSGPDQRALEPFHPGLVQASARVFVVFLLD